MVRMRRVLVGCMVCMAVSASGAAQANNANWLNFFAANNNAYGAYINLNDQRTDGAGYPLRDVKLTAFSDTFRGWIKTNFPGGETAQYAIDPYSIDCADKTVAEHRLVWFDSNGFPLADYDFSGKVSPPIAGSMKEFLVQSIYPEVQAELGASKLLHTTTLLHRLRCQCCLMELRSQLPSRRSLQLAQW